MTKHTISILGTAYEIIFGSSKELPELLERGAVGICYTDDKTIFILENCTADEVLHTYRHELLHAFFYESGLQEYCKNETLVDFLAVQFPKLEQLLAVELYKKPKPKTRKGAKKNGKK